MCIEMCIELIFKLVNMALLLAFCDVVLFPSPRLAVSPEVHQTQ